MKTFVLVALLLAGCAEALPPLAACTTPAEIHVRIASGSLLNPDPSGAALPTEIRVLALRDGSALESASFDEVWAPSSALAGATVSTDTLTLYPGEIETVTVATTGETHALAAVAIVRQPAGRTWRVIVPVDALPCGGAASLALHADEYRIERDTTESR